MKHFVLPHPPNPDGMIRLYEKDFHYLVRVRRLKAGMYFDAVLPGGMETKIRILSTKDNILIGECLEKKYGGTPEQGMQNRETKKNPLPPIVLFQGLPRGAKMDLIVRQAAEGGVSIIVPFESEFSSLRIGRLNNGEKMNRWERIVKEARQQSGSVIETEIKAPCSFDALLQYWESLKGQYDRPLGIVFHQESLEKGTFHGYLGNNPGLIALAVGPEGGFSSGEIAKLLSLEFKPLLLGNTVLRTETAALYGTAALRIILLESEAWIPRSTDSFS